MIMNRIVVSPGGFGLGARLFGRTRSAEAWAPFKRRTENSKNRQRKDHFLGNYAALSARGASATHKSKRRKFEQKEAKQSKRGSVLDFGTILSEFEEFSVCTCDVI
jgi:hypothetical protein